MGQVSGRIVVDEYGIGAGGIWRGSQGIAPVAFLQKDGAFYPQTECASVLPVGFDFGVENVVLAGSAKLPGPLVGAVESYFTSMISALPKLTSGTGSPLMYRESSNFPLT
ncbi:MAG: hypothetical protein AAF998_25025 [Bacteroidota bacterium]